MNTFSKAFLCALTFGVATQANAAVKEILGSDTLHEVTNFMLKLDPDQTGVNATPAFANANAVRDYVVARTGLSATHPLVTSLMAYHSRECGQVNYPVKGSGDGETAMCADTQEVAPMSRRLGSKICVNSAADNCFEQAHGGSASGTLTAVNRTVGLDALAIVRNGTTAQFNGCDDLGRGNACAADSKGWQYKLGVIYGGVNYASNAAANGSGTFESCDHATRRALVADWSELLNGCTAEDTSARCLAGLRHALRRNDSSGTTTTFRDFVGIKAPTGTTGFCNGTQTQDNDPIRVKCRVDTLPAELGNQNERFCPATHIGGNTAAAYQGSLGVVMPVYFEEFVAGTANIDAKVDAVHDNRACTNGKFASRARPNTSGSHPFALPAGKCPNGATAIAGTCRWPYRETGLAAPNDKDFGCNNSRTNLPADSLPNQDGRRYNNWYRLDDGTIIYNTPNSEPASKFSRTSADCSLLSATDQIGCIVASQKCFIGFGGREVLGIPNTAPLQMESTCTDCAAAYDSVSPWGERTDAGFEGQDCTKADAFEERCTIGCYPMRRKLFFNTLSGFGSASAPEETGLRDCYLDNDLTAKVMRAHFFEPVAVQENQDACLVCGNGIVEAGETCDDGNDVNGDACPNDCTIP